jgi:outer membrane lipoprotein SlyB
VINGTAYPIVTDQYEIRGRGEGRSTARRVVGGTGLGTLVGGIAGGGRGAGVGAVAGAGAGTVASSAKGEQVSLTQQSLIEFRLGHPVALPVGT